MRLSWVLLVPLLSKTILCVIYQNFGATLRSIDISRPIPENELLGWLIKHQVQVKRTLDFSDATLDDLKLLPMIYYTDHSTDKQMEQVWEILSAHQDSELDSFLLELKQIAEHFDPAARTPTKNSIPVFGLNSSNDSNIIWDAIERRTPKRKEIESDNSDDLPVTDDSSIIASSSSLNGKEEKEDNEELFYMEDEVDSDND